MTIDISALVELAAKGLCDREIAAILNTSRACVRRARHRLDIPSSAATRPLLSEATRLPASFRWPFTKAQLDKCRSLGLTRRDIARRVGRSVGTVNNRYRDLALSKPRAVKVVAVASVTPKPDRFRQWPCIVDDYAQSELPPEDGAPFRKPVLRPRNFAERNDPAFRGLVTA